MSSVKVLVLCSDVGKAEPGSPHDLSQHPDHDAEYRASTEVNTVSLAPTPSRLIQGAKNCRGPLVNVVDAHKTSSP